MVTEIEILRSLECENENDSFDLKSKIQVFVWGAGESKKIVRGFD
jgi:hypothetical protein